MSKRKMLERRLETLLHEPDPLDENQQNEVIETMATLQSYHDVFWTRTFSVISLILSLGYFIDACLQMIYPFQMKHRGLWEPFLSSYALIGCEGMFGICLFFCFIAVWIRGRKRKEGFMWTPMSLTTICCSFITLYMIISAISDSRNITRKWYHLEVLWIPLLPMLYCLVIYYIVGLLDRSFKEVEKLKARRYPLKGA